MHDSPENGKILMALVLVLRFDTALRLFGMEKKKREGDGEVRFTFAGAESKCPDLLLEETRLT